MKDLNLRALAHDLAIALGLGLAIAGGLSLLLLLIGLLINGFAFRPALVLVRGGLLVTGAMALFVIAGLLIASKDGAKVRDYRQWTRFFKVFGLIPVLAIAAVVILYAGSLVDGYLYF